MEGKRWLAVAMRSAVSFLEEDSDCFVVLRSCEIRERKGEVFMLGWV